MKSSKSTTNKPRNPYALHAKKRRAKKIRPKDQRRQNGKNKQRELLEEAD